MAGTPKMRWTFISIALFALGLLIFVPSGLCTAAFGIMSLFQGGDMMGLALVVGGLPMAMGAALIWAGLSVRRPKDPPPGTEG